MSNAIVPLETPQSYRFDKKRKNDFLLKIHRGKIEFTFFKSAKRR